MDISGVIIDGALPRSQYERCCTLFDYLVSISSTGPHSDLDPGHVQMKEFGTKDRPDDWYDQEIWHDLENEITDAIERKLPMGYEVHVGDFTPGDVVVVETEDVDPRPMVTQHGENEVLVRNVIDASGRPTRLLHHPNTQRLSIGVEDSLGNTDWSDVSMDHLATALGLFGWDLTRSEA